MRRVSRMAFLGCLLAASSLAGAAFAAAAGGPPLFDSRPDARPDSGAIARNRVHGSPNVTEAEYRMEDDIRALAGEQLSSIARRLGWRVQEMAEQGDRPAQSAPAGGRAPHHAWLVYRFVIDSQALDRWADAIRAEGGGALAAGAAAADSSKGPARTMEEDPTYKAYQDSLRYYSERQMRFVSRQQAAYAQALLRGDRAFTAGYDREQRLLLAKIDLFTKKLQSYQDERSQGAAEGQRSLLRKLKTLRDAGILTVVVEVNPASADLLTDQEIASTAEIRVLQEPGLAGGAVYVDRSAYEGDGASRNGYAGAALLLFGRWAEPPKGGGEGAAPHLASFTAARPPERVQAIAIHAYGGEESAGKFADALDPKPWRAAIGR